MSLSMGDVVAACLGRTHKRDTMCQKENKNMRISDENLKGRTVIAADGQVIGGIAALFIDTDTWRVESLQVKLGKEIADELGANRSLFHAGSIEVAVALVQSIADAVILTIPLEGLREVLPAEEIPHLPAL